VADVAGGSSGEVRVEGLNRLIRTLDKASAEVAELKDAHQRAGEVVASEARSRAPRRTGALANTIRSARQARRARVQVGTRGVPYAAPIHWGWPARGIAANPFVSEAAQDTESRWTAGYHDDVQKALDKVKGA
jgi:Bacteriophage HK97-gp10, putative tail-component